MKSLNLQVGQDHVEKLTVIRNPIRAIEELIWNALDADATQIAVELKYNKMNGMQSVTISDNGIGIRFNRINRTFGEIGESEKKKQIETTLGRVPHGRFGKGRFCAFGLGAVVTWHSKYKQNGEVKEFEISGNRSQLKKFNISDEKICKNNETGVTVSVTNINKNMVSNLEDTQKISEELSRIFAIYLLKYPGIKITYESNLVDPKQFQTLTHDYTVETPEGLEGKVELTVIEWNKEFDRKIYFCDAEGIAFADHTPRIHAKGFNFTAYVKGDGIVDLEERGEFNLEPYSEVVTKLIENSKEVLKAHFRGRSAEQAIDLVKRWKKEEIYPYKNHENNPLITAEREVFDTCAVTVNTFLPKFEKSDNASKKLTFQLLKKALERDPGSLHSILREVLVLPEDEQNELAELLDRTQLSAIISASKTIINRLDFLAALDEMLFGNLKKTLYERKQLHRILAEELWIFGEQYDIGVDDQSLKSLLDKHIHILKREELAEEGNEDVTDIDGKQRIVDLMLYKQIPLTTPGHFEHLIIELKRPKKKISVTEIDQIKKYGYAILEDERFDKSKVKWNLVLIGNELDKWAQYECAQKDREYGHIGASESMNIYVKQWSTIIHDAKWRYQFYQDKLKVEISNNDGLRYLREKHSDKISQNELEVAGLTS
ncbi:ATP-binding protein [Planctomycetota bacterium]|nr:ATP-binding protein [Planctomycetota bacterium]